MLARVLRELLKRRGIQVLDSPVNAPLVVVAEGDSERIQHWDEHTLGPVPTSGEIAAIDSGALLVADAASDGQRNADALFVQTIRAKWESEFIPLRDWARTKGYPG